jgi:class 3 adenylate cyclase
MGERRPVAVLFADLVKFTELSSNRDPEGTHSILGRYFETVDGIIARYGGAIDKHIGDSVMAVFGAPIARGNDPERAIRAAVDIHRTMIRLGDATGIRLEVRVGIASGQVIASGTGSSRHQEYTVTGQSVNLASRLQSMAGVGETLISEAVHRAVAALVHGEALGEVAVKGLAEPVRVWRVGALRAGASIQLRRSFVGRRAELAQFTGSLEACCASGTGQAIYVRGEAGIGKTRLVEDSRPPRRRRASAHTGDSSSTSAPRKVRTRFAPFSGRHSRAWPCRSSALGSG